jgi:outer membrane protein TolC
VSASITIGAVTLALALTGCTIGPNYSREAAPVSTHYKELKGWKRATPIDDVARGDWWTVYKDRALDSLLPHVEVSNQTVAAAAAAYEEARAVIREAQSALFPVATIGYSVTRTRTGPLALGSNTSAGAGSFGGVTGGRGAIYRTTYTVPISATWDLDIWGRIRRQVPIRRARKPPPPISTMPNSPPRPSSRSPISICAHPIP